MPDVTIGANEVSSGKITLVADEVSTVTLAFARRVEIISDGAAEVWYSFDTTVPAVGDKDCFYLPDSACATERQSGATVSFISSGTPTIVVQHA